MPLQIACHTDQFGTLGQITPDDVAQIARQGYKSIINNRPDGEGGPDQPKNADIQAEAERLEAEAEQARQDEENAKAEAEAKEAEAEAAIETEAIDEIVEEELPEPEDDLQ